MALVPKITYPVQTISSDPAYPYGKAQNITTVGDATGTPWEAALVNDLFGFQQALLAAGGITPSGNPDSVAASDYLAAVLSIIRNIAHTYTAAETFNADARFKSANTRFDAGLKITDVANAAEMIYSPSRTRTVLVPLELAVGADFLHPNGTSGANAMRLVAATTNTHIKVPIVLPTLCTVTKVRAGVSVGGGGGSTIAMHIYSRVPDLVTGGPGTLAEADPAPTGVTVTGASGTDHVLQNVLALPLQSMRHLFTSTVEIVLPNIGDAVNFIELTFQDPGPRNF